MRFINQRFTYLLTKHYSKQIHLVGEVFLVKNSSNTTNYSYCVDVSVSISDLHQKFLIRKMHRTDGNVCHLSEFLPSVFLPHAAVNDEQVKQFT